MARWRIVIRSRNESTALSCDGKTALRLASDSQQSESGAVLVTRDCRVQTSLRQADMYARVNRDRPAIFDDGSRPIGHDVVAAVQNAQGAQLRQLGLQCLGAATPTAEI